jgi:SAM-dependent methyltransferase
MTQNIYDNTYFFQEYSRMERSLLGLAGAPEWPSLRSMLPDLTGARVLDLGCGFGWFSRWAREQGARSVLAFDVSEKMLHRAIEINSDNAISYRQMNLEDICLPEAGFDLAFSSLTLHYIENLDRVFESVRHSLIPGGSFVFSTEHPIYTAPRHPEWLVEDEGSRIWPVNQYLEEGVRVTDWLAKGVVKQHRTIATTLNSLIRSRFVLTHVDEWGPSDDQIGVHPEWAEHRDRPMFLLVSAKKQRGYESERSTA